MVAVRQHAVHDRPLFKRRPEGLRHVRKILPHRLGVDARHEPVVLDLDRRDRVLVEQLSEHHQSILEECVALRRRQVRGPRGGDGAREPRPGAARHFRVRFGCSVWYAQSGRAAGFTDEFWRPTATI